MERALHGDCVCQLGAAFPSTGSLELPEGLGARSADGLSVKHSRPLQWSAGEFGTEHGPAHGWFRFESERATPADENRRTGGGAEWAQN